MNKSNSTAAAEIAAKRALLAALVKKNLQIEYPPAGVCYFCDADPT